MSAEPAYALPRVTSGVEGLDEVAGDGLPAERLTLVAGTAGSGKTLFAAQFLAAGVEAGEPGVFVTFEERPESIRNNFRSFGWDVSAWEEQGLWCFVDAAPSFEDEVVVAGNYDLASLVVRVKHAVARIGAKRVALDSSGSLVDQFSEPAVARRALFQIAIELRRVGVTTVMTAERTDDYGGVTKHGFEEFVADSVVILRNTLSDEKRRRTIEILKLRGSSHLRGEHLFTILGDRGIVVIPQKTRGFGYASSHTRLTCGLPELDAMMDGGPYDRSLLLYSGPTGTGKSLLTGHFLAGGVARGEKAILFSFEESRDQLARNAQAWGLDFDALEAEGRLLVLAEAPEAATLEDHLLRMKAAIDRFAPDRVAIDSVTALQRVATETSFREYLLGLSFHIKSNAMVGLITATTDDANGAIGRADLHMSTVSDAVVVLTYVGKGSEIRRALTVLKLRGSNHDKSVREYTIDDRGMHIGEPIEIDSWNYLPRAL